jgi:YVTN family beta-propeller protein
VRTNILRKITFVFILTAFFAVVILVGAKAAPAVSDEIKFIDIQGSQGRKITPAGKLVVDAATNRPAVGSLPVDMVRSPDANGPGGKGRYLLSINSGFGIQFDSKTNRGQQSISVIDLNAPEPRVIQTIYFPAPQSANFGLRFDEHPDEAGNFRLFVSGGYENKVWMFRFSAKDTKPVSPSSDGPETKITAPFIDVSSFTENAPTPNYNNDIAAVYPTGIALSPDANTLFCANNLSDNLGIVSDVRDSRKITRVSLARAGSSQFLYPYDVEVVPSADRKTAAKAFVSLWGDASIAMVDLKNGNRVSRIAVDRHPTAMILNKAKTRLYVVNSDADSVSVVDTAANKMVERIDLRLSESALAGGSPEGLALSEDEKTLYVANAHANSVAVVSLNAGNGKSKLEGFIPTGQYASAIAVVGDHLFVANGKGTGAENSSLIVNNSGFFPNAPNAAFPPPEHKLGGQYSVSVVSGNISYVQIPNERELFGYTQQVMRNNDLLSEKKTKLFNGPSPIKHVMYIIRENRTYDQVFGDVTRSGDGHPADGDAKLAIFGAGDTAKSPRGEAQNITPNAHALAQRFGLMDRFFVNSEASPDGHNWSTAAFSSDYVDKAFRWDYSGRGRSYDYEGFNRLPALEPAENLPPIFDLPVTEKEVSNYMKQYVPYLNGARDIAEPETLYLWDAAKRAGRSYRNYGEFLATLSENDINEVNKRKDKSYPDISRTVSAFPTKKSLEGHFNPTYRNFDLMTPDIMTTESYTAAKTSSSRADAEVTADNRDPKFRGNSRFGEWLAEFRGYVGDLNSGKGDRMPELSIFHVSNDHTNGYRLKTPTPQFYVAENDYAIGRMVEEVSKSPYWKDTVIFIVEDDAQDGPDHVDAHRSPGIIVSAYNKKGVLLHDFYNTVGLIRTIEILLRIQPMNLLDSTATPIDIFQDIPDLTPYEAALPEVAPDNLMVPEKAIAEMRKYVQLSDEQDLTHPDMADPAVMNRIIWASIRGDGEEMPGVAKLPAFDLMTIGINKDDDDAKEYRAQNIKHRKDDD